MLFRTKHLQIDAKPERPDPSSPRCCRNRWAAGTSPDGKGSFEYLENPQPMSQDDGMLNPVDPRLYGTPPQPVPKTARE
ncbi:MULTISPECIES: hypothetical protein [unclassified Paracoccus (in: a-proteobacteria)]|uniref:hypothetical protein n=1 Tax=unclassified Paracoccus (in: a-proteobacteria) TaxID=2688777 RepID=UPI0016038CEC|nr:MULTISPECIES: hypothetical protein [unclassified Paracoccus (in: a-proteobacteria)]MBB1492578.1 hypothetical protein [Paracoccus sp. MC1854]MBB1498401.1 hypothetical protein [Paracoccus sp. MC1862]QQO44391.1 hypothetical protein JGR78_13675 [Paracoccus sp. MC1862]